METRIIEEFKKQLPVEQIKVDEPLAKHTTLKVGGPADLFLVVKKEDELINVVELAKKLKIDFIILGWGSNVLISDAGFRGLVIKNQTQEIEILGPAPEIKHETKVEKEVDRHEHVEVEGKKYPIKFDDLDYDESDLPAKLVSVSTGVPLANLIHWSHEHGLTGLQWYSRIPGTVGGAVFNNIHGGTHFFGEIIWEVTILDVDGQLRTLKVKDLELAYDKSRFHDSKEVIVNVTLRLPQGDVEKAKHIALEWAQRKSVQPSNSAGCTFKNISQEEKERLGYPSTSIAYIIEWILKWSNKKIGDARISEKHHAFIVNDGKATAADVLEMIKEIQRGIKEKTGIHLEPEIFFIGFSSRELKGITH